MSQAWYDPETKQVHVHPAAIVKDRDGVELLRVDSIYDLSSLSEAQVAIFLTHTRVLLSCVGFIVPAQSDIERAEKQAAAVAKYRALPWYRRLFTPYPWTPMPS